MPKPSGKKFLLEKNVKIWYNIVCEHFVLADDIFLRHIQIEGRETMDKHSILKEYFGYTAFRQGQEAIIDRILSGGDVLGIMPTGAGKSICYQVPAMLLNGMTIVVSPLISLMQDQVRALEEAGIPAACLHSGLSQQAYFTALDAVRAGRIRLLYAAPERLLTDSFLSLTETVPIAMVAVDEAHCLSQWGQDFRPSYLQIADFLRALPRRPVVAAFTATATDTVSEDIKRLLSLEHPLELVTGFDRPNLRWMVEEATPSKKYEALLKILRRNQGKSGIIYCISRRLTEEVCQKLCADGYQAVRYHAGLSPEERAANQDAFLRDDAQIITATNAFGMGIDKSNVSFVVHYNMPRSMEAYYQEAGRAGRDGMPAECTLLFSPQDIRTNELFIDGDSENELLSPEQREIVRKQDRKRLQEMVRYCYCSRTDCLRQYILEYFGEKAPSFCGNCGSCLADSEEIDATIAAQKILSCVYRLAQRGIHGSARLISDILAGKKTKQITENSYDTLTTFNLMHDTAAAQIRHMTEILLARGYLAVHTDEYLSLYLTPRANAVLRGQEAVRMALPKKDLRQTERERLLASMPDFELDNDLFTRLRKLRGHIAAKESMPAYIVFSDATLRDMCIKRPTDEETMLAVSGVGKYKFDKYGEAFLAEIRAFTEESNAKKKAEGGVSA